jgi:hypothetical protein
VKIVSSTPLVIADGQELLVVGRRRAKVFMAYAHRNLSTGHEGHEGWATRLLVTILVVTAALWLGSLMGGPYAMVSGIVFVALGFAMAWRSLEVVQALVMLRR